MNQVSLRYEDGREAVARGMSFSREQYEQLAAEGIAKALVLGKKIESGPTNAFEIDSMFESYGHGGKIVVPPYDPLTWSLTPEQSPRLSRAISAWARNTVGLGWRVVARDFAGDPVDLEDPKNKKAKAQFEKEREALLRLFKFPNSSMPFVEIMNLIKIDEESTGNGYLEVVRNNQGKIVSLYHVPAVSIRALQDNKGFVQIRGVQFNSNADSSSNILTRMINGSDKPSFRFFKHFGDQRPMHRNTGSFEGRIGLQNRASEIVHFKLYSPRSSVYGVPRYVSVAPAIMGNRYAAIRNVKFFEHDAVPRAILSVTGGSLDQASLELMEEFFKHKTQGPDNAGRLLVLQVKPRQTGLGGKDSGASVDFKPITVGVTEDASYLGYKASNDEDIREVMELAEAYFSVDLVNRSSAEISKAITEVQSFEPDRIKKEFIINNTIVADAGWKISSGEGPGIEIAHLEFERPSSLDPMEVAQIDAIYSEMGVKTVNEIRVSLGLDPYPTEMGFGSKPLIVALEEMRSQLTPTTGDPKLYDKIRAEEQKIAMAQAKAAAKAKPPVKAQKSNDSLSDTVRLIRNKRLSRVDEEDKEVTLDDESLKKIDDLIKKSLKKSKKSE